MTRALYEALKAVAGMKCPTVAEILRSNGYGYEADKMDALTGAFEEMQNAVADITPHLIEVKDIG